jgi:Cu/Ag efflux pump CusA
MLEQAGGRVNAPSLAPDALRPCLSRENVQRTITVTGKVAGRDLGIVVDDARRAVADGVMLRPGYRIECSGQFESSEQASALLCWLGPRRRRRDVLPAGGGIPLGAPGRIDHGQRAAGAYRRHRRRLRVGGVLSAASIIALIALLGFAARNGILLVSHIEHLRHAEGVADLREAVTRLHRSPRADPDGRAVDGLALAPVALGAGAPGIELQAPMASVMIFGLASSTTCCSCRRRTTCCTTGQRGVRKHSPRIDAEAIVR